jgi:hypothetical protein
MSVTTVSFQHTTLPSETYLTQLGSDGPPYTVHGVALGAGDITQGASGIKKKWPAEELEEAADTLEETNLVVDHKNNADGVVGKVVKAGYKEGTGVVYEAELYEEELAEKIENGLLEVSIRGYHADVSELDEDDETGALIVEDITFDNLSIVPQGASPSNTLKMGEHEELTAAELEAAIVGIKADELLDEPEPGMWVTDGDMHGITVGMPEDGEIEVDVYEESDGQWRSTEETMMVSTDDLSEWDVEESDIGPVEDDSDEEENSRCLDIVASLMDMSTPMPEDAQLLYPSKEKAQEAAEMMGLDGIHEHDFEGETWYMPGADHAAFEDAMDEQSTEENAALIEEGMKFFSTVNDSQVFVKDVSGKMVTVQVVDGESMWKEEVDNIIQKLADGDWEHAGEMDSSEMIETPDLREGMMVEWQVMPQMKGRIVHNPEDEPFVMVEVMEDGEPSGYTLTAGYTDIRPMDTEEMAQDAKFSRGDWVNWDTRNSTELGKVTGAYMEGDDLPDFRGSRGLSPEGDEILYALRMYKQRDGSWHPIKGKPIGHYEDSLRSAQKPSEVSDSPVELVQSDVDVAGVKETALLASEPLVDRPTSGERQATFHVPLVGEFTESDVGEALSIAEEELGKEITIEMTDEGVFVQPVEDTGVGVVEFMHGHLDVIESSFDNTIDIQQKSTLFVGGDADGYSMQPCFMMGDRLSDEQLDEIARLYKFVTGVDSNPYYAENRLYLDTGQDTLAHASLDIAEILVRRMADAADIGIQAHSFKVLEETASELGRSNAQNYTDFSVDDWVQWYTETGERHGRVTSVDEENEQVTAQVWDQTSDGEWYETDEDVTKAFDDKIEPWGNFPREQDDFADTIEGEDPRRAVKPSEEENTDFDELISEQVKDALKEKAEEHNEEHGDEEGKRVTYRMLKNVFERGMGAYQDSHREGMSPQQWSYARVNAFLYLVRNGQPENDQYVQDNDLLPEDHPKYDEDAPDDNDSEENALTTTDVIVSDVFGQHDAMGSDEHETPQSIVERVVTAELESDEDELDEVYSEWSDAVNMTASELRRWSKNPCSREASLEPVSVIKRNLRLLETNKNEWTENDISDAKRTISFIARMRGTDSADLDGGPHGCPSKRDISLLNWAYNPFDSMPEHPDSDELDAVEEVTLAADEGETHSGEASDVASLADYEMHEVSYEGTHDNEWDRPNLEDFVEAMGIEDDVSEYDDLTQQAQEDVASAFILSASGFPADDYGDLKLPVVEPTGELSLNALAAVKGGRGASAVEDLSDEMEDEIDDYVNQLASDEFDRNWSEEENMPKHYGEKDDEEYMDVPDDHMFESESDAEDKAEDMGISGAHKMGDMWVPGASHEEYMMAVEEMASTATGKSVDTDVQVALQTDNNKLTLANMNDQLEEQLSELDNPVAVEAEELEDLESKADRFDEMSENLEALRERTEVIDEVDQSALEELRSTEEPVVVEEESYEELQTEAEQVKGVYAASLAEEMGAFEADELADRFSIEELREKFEKEIGSVEEELAATGSEEAEPRSQDPSEEELAQVNGESEEELSDEVAQKQQEIRQKILSN